jgi:hypothetical protein
MAFRFTRTIPLGLLLVSSVVLMGGCDSPEPVTVYTVPTSVPPQLRQGKERMLAAMIPRGDEAWFFKVTGPLDAMGGIESAYRKFVESVEFGDEGPDVSELPEGWRLGPEKPMRVASIDVETPSKQLDISISKLGRQEDWDSFVVMNVNRWRGQLGLPPSTEKWAGGTEMDVEAADGDSVWVDLVGQPSSGGSMSAAPFAGMTPPAGNFDRSTPQGTAPTAVQANSPSGAPAQRREPPFDFDRPEGWQDGDLRTMRLAAFNMGPDDAQAELTVIPASGDARANVARWLGQIRRGAVDDDDVQQALADLIELDVAGRPAERYVLSGGSDGVEAIDVTIVPLGDGVSLFIKMQGPSATVIEQFDKITGFLESLELKD